jgi:hypothetical protein
MLCLFCMATRPSRGQDCQIRLLGDYSLVAFDPNGKMPMGESLVLRLYPDSAYMISSGVLNQKRGKWFIAGDGRILFIPNPETPRAQRSPIDGYRMDTMHQEGRLTFFHGRPTSFSLENAGGRLLCTRKYEAIEIDGYRFLLPRQGYSFWPGKKRWKIVKIPRLEK